MRLVTLGTGFNLVNTDAHPENTRIGTMHKQLSILRLITLGTGFNLFDTHISFRITELTRIDARINGIEYWLIWLHMGHLLSKTYLKFK